jgi:hypothetical protein
MLSARSDLSEPKTGSISAPAELEGKDIADESAAGQVVPGGESW